MVVGEREEVKEGQMCDGAGESEGGGERGRKG